jgi:uncharacterized membrane protein
MSSSSNGSLVFRALCLGLAGGLRSWPPLGALALKYDAASHKDDWRSWPVFRSSSGRNLLIALAATEFITDKLPWTQSRLALSVQPSTIDGGLLGRVAAVTLAGAALGSERGGKDSILAGAAFAAVGAILGNYGGYHGRKAVVEVTGLPDNAVAVVEDVAAVAVLSTAVSDG